MMAKTPVKTNSKNHGSKTTQSTPNPNAQPPTGKGTLKSKTKPQPKTTKSTSPKSRKLEYSMTMEITVTTTPTPLVSSDTKTFSTLTTTLDSLGQLFHRETAQIYVDERLVVRNLSSRDVKNILNILEVAPYGDI